MPDSSSTRTSRPEMPGKAFLAVHRSAIAIDLLQALSLVADPVLAFHGTFVFASLFLFRRPCSSPSRLSVYPAPLALCSFPKVIPGRGTAHMSQVKATEQTRFCGRLIVLDTTGPTVAMQLFDRQEPRPAPPTRTETVCRRRLILARTGKLHRHGPDSRSMNPGSRTAAAPREAPRGGRPPDSRCSLRTRAKLGAKLEGTLLPRGVPSASGLSTWRGRTVPDAALLTSQGIMNTPTPSRGERRGEPAPENACR